MRIIKQAKDSSGFTLAELLVTLVISALLAIVIGRMMSTVSGNVSYTANNLAAAQQALSVVNQIKYDFSGAIKATVWDSNIPTAAASCSSRSPQSGGAYVLPNDPGKTSTDIGVSQWLWNASGTAPNASLLRTLAYVEVQEPVDMTSPEETALTSFVGYEIRRAYKVQGRAEPYELWRVQCSTLGLLDSSRPPIKLTTLGYSDTSFAYGKDFFRCTGASVTLAAGGEVTDTPCSVGADVLATNQGMVLRLLYTDDHQRGLNALHSQLLVSRLKS